MRPTSCIAGLITLALLFSPQVSAQVYDDALLMLVSILEDDDTEGVEGLLDSGAEVNARDQNERTALHFAARNGTLYIARMLLERGAQASAADVDGWTPLHVAVYRRSVAVAQLLLENGADPNIGTLDDYLFQAGSTPLHIASAMESPDIVTILLDGGANPDALDEEGLAPLHRAAAYGSPTVINVLLDHGADIYSAPNGWTPLHEAVLSRNFHAAVALLSRGADPLATDDRNESALDIAERYGDWDFIELLTEADEY